MNFVQDWREKFIDEMGLIVALNGEERFTKLSLFKNRINDLNSNDRAEIKNLLKLRFTPSSINTNNIEFNGCRAGTESVEAVL